MADVESDALEQVEVVKHLTYVATIMSPRLRVAESRGYDLVRGMFEKLTSPSGHMLMPDDCRDLYETFSETAAKKRIIANFIAGMTDRYAVEFYGRLVSENPTSMFKPL